MSADFLEKDVVYVSSANRLSGTSNSFSFKLTSQIRPGIGYDTISLLKCSIPKSYYLFTSNNNTFVVNENGVSHTITIPVGNYSKTSLVAALRILFTASLTWTYQVNPTPDTSSLTGKLSFTVSGNGGIQPIFDFSIAGASSTGAYLILGFDRNSYTFSGDQLIAPNVVNLQLTSTVQIFSDLVEGDLLSVIIPDNTDFSVINYLEQNPTFVARRLKGSANFDSATFSLKDGNTGLPLDLNGLDYNFVFAIYKKNNYYKTMLIDKKLELLALGQDDPED